MKSEIGGICFDHQFEAFNITIELIVYLNIER